MDYKKLHEETLTALQQMVSESKITEEIARSICADFVKESEDERIRKALITYIKYNVSVILGWGKNELIAWLEKQGNEFDRGYEVGASAAKYNLEKQGEQKPTSPVWKYKKDNTPLLRDSFILNKYGCVAKSPSGALVSDVWVLDFDELAKLPKEEFERQSKQKPDNKVEPKFKVGDTIVEKDTDECGCGTIKEIRDGKYIFEDNCYIHIKEQELWRVVKEPVEPKFKVGDWIIDKDNTWKICNISLKTYYELLNINNEVSTKRIEDVDKTAHLWTIKDAKDGDILATNDGGICIFDNMVEEGIYPFAYCGLTRHYGFEVYDRKLPFTHDKDVHPAIKEQRDILFTKMKEAGYEWNAENKELRKIEQKPEIKDDVLSRFAFYQYDDDTLYLSSVFVEECNRKHGYGTKILKAAEGVAKTFGVSKIRLKVERNTWMEEWYKKNGYEYLSSDGEYNWLENRVIDIKPDKIKQKSTWSEEDERILGKCIDAASGYYSPEEKQSMKDWLRSLKERMKGNME